MTPPDFTFNEKTGELSRGRALVLSRLHREIFAALWQAHKQVCRISSDHIRRTMTLNVSVETVDAECREIAHRIRPLGISIAADANALRWLVFGEVPKRKEPSIPEPFRLEGESTS